MLRRLTVKNLAIVEDLEMELDEGLTVITGETGRGQVHPGGRALARWRAGGARSTSCARERRGSSVAGEFDGGRGGPADRCRRPDLPDGETVLVQREFSPDGKGRAFVEDEPASVRTLAKLGERLVTIHGQNSERELVDPEAPLELLDAFARARDRAARDGRGGAGAGARRGRRSTALEASRRDRETRLEMLDFQIREIAEAAPDPRGGGGAAARARAAAPRRPDPLGPERPRSRALSEDEGSAADRLGEAARAFAELAAIDPRERVASRRGRGPQAPHRGPRRGGARRGRSRSKAIRTG